MHDDTLNSPLVAAHATLQTWEPALERLTESADMRLCFLSREELTDTGAQASAVLLPAASEPEGEGVRELREELALVPIIAVVSDVLGHQTYNAIRSGATAVLNLVLPAERQLDVLWLIRRSPAQPDLSPERDLAAEPGPAAQPAARRLEPTGTVDSAAGLAEESALVDLLCSPTSVAGMAHRFYCSERSMYRRIRLVYQKYGVSGRRELRARMAGTALVHTHRFPG